MMFLSSDNACERMQCSRCATAERRVYFCCRPLLDPIRSSPFLVFHPHSTAFATILLFASVMDLVSCLSFITTSLCLFLKLPQIITVIRSGSVAGLSRSSLMLEFWRSVPLCLLSSRTVSIIQTFHTVTAQRPPTQCLWDTRGPCSQSTRHSSSRISSCSC